MQHKPTKDILFNGHYYFRSIRTNWATRKPPSVTGGGAGGGGGKELNYDEVGPFFCQLQVSIVFRCSRNRVLPIVQCMRAVVQVAMKMRCGARLANSEGSWRLDFGNSGHLTYFSISGALLQRQRLRLREIRQQGVCLQCNCGIASHRGFATD